jgi:hypothetical protein
MKYSVSSYKIRSECCVRKQAGGVLSYAAVPHGGLWPPIAPLSRYAEYTTDQLSRDYGG